jgi:phage-related minor tail protein
LTGDDLEATAAQMLEMTRLTGGDLASNITEVSRVFGDWGVATDDQGARMDQLFRASQATGIGVDDLSSQLVKFGAPLRQLGFGFEESAALISAFEKEGVNGELVMGSMRIALGKLARAGEPAEETFRRVTDQIADAGSTSEANALALELFGARAGPDMAAAIREGRFEVGDLIDQIASGEDTIRGAAADTEDWRQKWDILKNRTLVALEPLAASVFGAMGSFMEQLAPKAEALAVWLGENIPRAVDFLRGVFEQVAAVVGPIVDGITTVVGGFRTAVTDDSSAISQIITTLGDTFRGIFDAIRGVVEGAMNLIQAIIEKVWPIISRIWEQHGERILAFVTGTFDRIKRVIQSVLGIIRGIFDAFAAIFRGDWSALKDALSRIWSALWDGIKAILEQAWEVLVSAFEVGKTLLKEAWQAIWDSITRIAAGVWEDAKEWGSNIVEGIWDGIKSMGSWLKEKLLK